MGMPETLPELMRLHGLGVTSIFGGRRVPTVSRICNGHNRAQRQTLLDIANALGEPIERVVAACDESWRQSQALRAQAAPPVRPVSDGQAALVGHADDDGQGGGA